jgi:hypothetical protein
MLKIISVFIVLFAMLTFSSCKKKNKTNDTSASNFEKATLLENVANNCI